ncbi:hypothetical protein EGJ47_03545 [Stutzerimonas stutzeri]|nr:hypothetical protein EGJ47_03545 [Stutzerimonas stutzeri]
MMFSSRLKATPQTDVMNATAAPEISLLMPPFSASISSDVPTSPSSPTVKPTKVPNTPTATRKLGAAASRRLAVRPLASVRALKKCSASRVLNSFCWSDDCTRLSSNSRQSMPTLDAFSSCALCSVSLRLAARVSLLCPSSSERSARMRALKCRKCSIKKNSENPKISAVTNQNQALMPLGLALNIWAKSGIRCCSKSIMTKASV